MDAWEACAVPLPNDTTRALVRLPPRHGGFGMTAAADISALAFVAARAAVLPLLPQLMAPDFAAAAASGDHRYVALESAPATLRHPTVAAAAAAIIAENDGKRRSPSGLQRHLAAVLAASQASDISAALGRAAQARMSSAASPHANAWLAPPPGSDDPQWLTPAEFDVLARLRLGLPVAEAPTLCNNCNRAVADVGGHHALSCMFGPSKWAVHNGVRDALDGVAGACLWAPVKEPALGSAKDRADILFRVRGPFGLRAVAADVAIIHEGAHLAAALSSPGGACAAYERVKLARYGAAAEAIGVTFVPVVADSAGAWGPSALPLFRTMAGTLARRFDLSFGRSLHLLMARISSCLMRGLAASVHRAFALVRPPLGSPPPLVDPLPVAPPPVHPALSVRPDPVYVSLSPSQATSSPASGLLSPVVPDAHTAHPSASPDPPRVYMSVSPSQTTAAASPAPPASAGAHLPTIPPANGIPI